MEYEEFWDIAATLAQLGFVARQTIDGGKYVLPPVCPVPAGPFLMGSNPKQDKSANNNEQPQHSITLATFQIGKYPVTVAEYACFVRATGRTLPRDVAGNDYHLNWQTQLDRLDHPVAAVTWDDATAYAAWLADCTGHAWRLPSEAEWEMAARWDAPTGTARFYPWGDTFDKVRCNTYEGGKGGTTPVGSYLSGSSPYVVLDMAGNVEELTSSLRKPYPYNPSDGRQSAEPPGGHLLRGGSWNSIYSYARAAFRGNEFFAIIAFDIDYACHGFRLAGRSPSISPRL